MAKIQVTWRITRGRREGSKGTNGLPGRRSITPSSSPAYIHTFTHSRVPPSPVELNGRREKRKRAVTTVSRASRYLLNSIQRPRPRGFVLPRVITFPMMLSVLLPELGVGRLKGLAREQGAKVSGG